MQRGAIPAMACDSARVDTHGCPTPLWRQQSSSPELSNPVARPRYQPLRGGAERSAVLRVWTRIAAVTAIVAALVALSGGFGTGFLAVIPRTIYWVGLSVAGATIGILVIRPRIPADWFDQRPLTAWGLLALGIAAPMTILAAAATTLINGRDFALSTIAEVFRQPLPPR